MHEFTALQNWLSLVKSRERKQLKIYSVPANRTRLGSIGENRCAVQRNGQIQLKCSLLFPLS